MNAHPNSVRLEVTGESGRKLEVIGASIGGGRIRICEIDGLTANFSGEAPTLVVYNLSLIHIYCGQQAAGLHRTGRGSAGCFSFLWFHRRIRNSGNGTLLPPCADRCV